ncbi:MAG: extracellular solute-binding protein [Pseudomonadota bacterium]
MRAILCAAALSVVCLPALAQETLDIDGVTLTSTHAITIYGDPPLYPADFPHWSYVNPDAPAGGSITLAAFGTFDSLNNYIVQGSPAAGLDLLYDGLIVGNGDEVRSYYLDVAEAMYVNDDRTLMVFDIHPDARFHDGEPILAEDVVFSHTVLEEQGAPRFKARFYDDVAEITALDERRVLFRSGNPANNQLLSAIATFPIFASHWWEGKDFSKSSLEPPVGSGPYRVGEIDVGRQICYERVEDYWGWDRPVTRGLFNFEEICYEYYRESTVRYEAFKAGEFDYLTVNSSQEWTTGFTDIDAVDAGTLKLEQIPSTDPEGFLGFWFNLRKPMFAEPKVREALTYFYDFETAKRTVHFGLYARLNSYFANTELSASGLPEGRELEILEPFRGKIPDEIFDEEFVLPTTDGSGNIRSNLRNALGLFKEAGWDVVDGKLTNRDTGEPMEFEILYVSPIFEKVLNPLVQNLKRGGIEATLRLVDTAQYRRRLDEFDYDMISLGTRAFYPPGLELRGAWQSGDINQVGNENFTGIEDPALDELVEVVIAADNWDEKIAATRALDRFLLWSYVAIPAYFDDSYRVAYWDVFDRPETKPRFGLGFPQTWWFEGANSAALKENR